MKIHILIRSLSYLLFLIPVILSAQNWTGAAAPDTSLSNNDNWTGTFNFPGSPGFADAHVSYNGTTGTLGAAEEFRVGETQAFQFRITEGTLLVNGGTLQANGNISLSSNSPTGDSTLTFTSGSISTTGSNQGLLLSNNANFNSTFNQSGGNSNFNSLFAQPSSGGSGAIAAVNVSAGNFNIIGFATGAPKDASDIFQINAAGGNMHITRQLQVNQSPDHNGVTQLNINGGNVRIDQGFATQNSGGSGRLDVTFTSGTLSSRANLATNTFAAHNGTFTVASGGSKTIQLISNALGNMNLSSIVLNDTLTISNQSTAGHSIVQTGTWSGTGGVNVVEGGFVLNGTYSSTGLFTVESGASLRGNSKFTGGSEVLVAGGLAPGLASLGVMEFSGDLTLESTASVTIRITGTTSGLFERIIGNNANTITLGGVLNLDNTGYDAVLGDSITIFSRWSERQGSFDAINGVDLGSGLQWDTSSLASTGVITVIPEPRFYSIVFGFVAVFLVIAYRTRSV